MLKKLIKYLYYKLHCYVGDDISDYARNVIVYGMPKGVDFIAFTYALRKHCLKNQGLELKAVALSKDLDIDLSELNKSINNNKPTQKAKYEKTIHYCDFERLCACGSGLCVSCCKSFGDCSEKEGEEQDKEREDG